MSNQSYVISPDVVDVDIGGDRALLHLKTNTYFTLNQTSAELWRTMAKPVTLDDMVAQVTEKFDVSAEQCRSDIEAVLQEMLAADVITAKTGFGTS